MTQEVGVETVYGAIEAAFRESKLDRVEGLLMPALDQIQNNAQLWFYAGCLQFKRGYAAMAAIAFTRSLELNDSPHVYSNLGACYRRMNRNEEGLRVLKTGQERVRDYPPALVNLGSMYVNEGNPEGGIPYLERALELGKQSGTIERGAAWNLGLLYLEAARFAEGFDCYREGVAGERATRNYGSEEFGFDDPEMLSDESFKAAIASGEKPQLIIWGEQGIGDELMFGTIIEDFREHFEVIFECHPRLMTLHAGAHPGTPLYQTRKEASINWPIKDQIRAKYKCAIGDLAAYYRRDLDAFKDAWTRRGPTYKADPAEVASYRKRLEAVAQGRPIVGLATHGGVMTTSRTYRTLRPGEDVDRLIEETDALFVSLDYDDMTALVERINEKHGEGRYLWFPSIVQHYDYEHAAALVAATDLTVTVCQSIAHLSAGMGHPTRCLTPIRCAWRYAPIPGEPDLWYWYPDEKVKLYRQDEAEGWSRPIGRVIEDIKALRAPKVEKSVSPGVGLMFGRGK
jgi:tetratricopeptide (TPR) repeat protein